MIQKIPKTFQEALANFEALESALELPSWTINEVYIWKLLRFAVFSGYQQNSGLCGVAHPEMERMKKTKVQHILEFPKLFFCRNPYFSLIKDNKRIVIPHTRKDNIEGCFVDPISYRAWHGTYKSSSLVLDQTSPLAPWHLSDFPDIKVLKYIAKLREGFIFLNLKAVDIKRIKEIEFFLQNKNLNLEAQVKKCIRSFLARKSIFHSFFRKIKPQALYIVVGYGNEAALAAAQDLKIDTVEFQHGSLERGHPGYDFRNWEFVPYFADQMLAFGPAWFDDCHFPKHCTLHFTGAPHIEDITLAAMAKITRKKQQLLVLSQGTVAEKLLLHVAEFIKLRPDWEVLIRPHPSENSKMLRTLLEKHIGNKVREVRIEREHSLAEQAAESTVALGVYSTAIAEALLAQCKVAILNLESVSQTYQHLIGSGNATLVENGQELAKTIDQLTIGSARDYFVKPIHDVVKLIEKNGKSADMQMD